MKFIQEAHLADIVEALKANSLVQLNRSEVRIVVRHFGPVFPVRPRPSAIRHPHLPSAICGHFTADSPGGNPDGLLERDRPLRPRRLSAKA